MNGLLGVASCLVRHVVDYGPQLSHTDGPYVMPFGPAECGAAREAVAIGDSGACSLEALHQAWDVEDRWEFENHVDVVRDYPAGGAFQRERP